MTPEDNLDAEFRKTAAPMLEAVGHVAHNWALLEYCINETIWALADVDNDKGACITAQITSIVPRMRALTSLAHRHACSDPLLKALNRFSARVDSLGRRRNRIVHDPWGARKDHTTSPAVTEFARLEITADKRLTYGLRVQTLEEINNISEQILHAINSFHELRRRIRDEIEEPTKSHPGLDWEEYLVHPVPDIDPE